MESINVKRFEVYFSAYQNAAGTIGVVNLCPARTIVVAETLGAARSMVEAQYSNFPRLIIAAVKEIR